MNMTIQLKKTTLFVGFLLILIGMQSIVYGQQKKEGNIQNDDIILEKERKIELKPEISRNFEILHTYYFIGESSYCVKLNKYLNC